MYPECPSCFETEYPVVLVIGVGNICTLCLEIKAKCGTLGKEQYQ